MKYTTIVVAAGSQTRFSADIPKGLVPFNNKTLLESNLGVLEEYTEDTIIVTNSTFYTLYSAYASDKVKVLQVSSGTGTLGAIREAFTHIPKNNKVILLWSDVVMSGKDLSYLHAVDNFEFLVPVTWEKDPYVQFLTTDNHTITKILFKRMGHQTTEGWHDLSYFVTTIDCLSKLVQTSASDILEAVEHLKLGTIYPVNEKSFAFNTIEEYITIMEELNENHY